MSIQIVGYATDEKLLAMRLGRSSISVSRVENLTVPILTRYRGSSNVEYDRLIVADDLCCPVPLQNRLLCYDEVRLTYTLTWLAVVMGIASRFFSRGH